MSEQNEKQFTRVDGMNAGDAVREVLDAFDALLSRTDHTPTEIIGECSKLSAQLRM